MVHPFQLLAHARPLCQEENRDGLLLLARRGQLLSTNLQNLETKICWPLNSVSTSPSGSKKLDANEDQAAKRQKTEHVDTKTSWPRIIKLALSPNTDHVVLVTEDKCLHVLAFAEDGSLTELSRRSMPKRPCAIQVLPDNATILCGDKFGDVYSLPLVADDVNDNATTQSDETTNPKPAFKPAASHLTVHSKRNRDALEAQIKQLNFTPSTKEPIKFKHELLLGHVSMLTDLTYASQKVEHGRRNYIITADRDEHIRISRAAPQAHIIEGYCLGHTDFISKIGLLPESNLLLSGGGDDWMGVWDWSSYKLIRRIDLKGAVRRAMAGEATTGETATEDVRVNVSGLWTCVVITPDSVNTATFVVVGCEKVPALFVIPADKVCSTDCEVSICPLDKVPIDLITMGQNIIVSVDDRDGGKRLRAFHFTQDQDSVRLVEDDDMLQKLEPANRAEEDASQTDQGLDDFLYSISNLRKWRGGDGEAEPEADGDNAE